jgi:hypothetical protein
VVAIVQRDYPVILRKRLRNAIIEPVALRVLLAPGAPTRRLPISGRWRVYEVCFMVAGSIVFNSTPMDEFSADGSHSTHRHSRPYSVKW